MNVEVYISQEEIQVRIAELAKKITNDYHGQEITVIAVLSGAFMFCADLVRQIQCPIKLEFMKVSSYGDNTSTSGEVKVDLDIKSDINDKHVLILEDIVDTGLTLTYLIKHLNTRHPKSLKLASLLSKPSRTVHPIKIDYQGFEIEDKFVIGYGLDYASKYRELPYIGILNLEC